MIEDQLTVSNGCSGALEYDAAVLLRPDAVLANPAPPELAACNSAVLLFHAIFPVITSQKHRLQVFTTNACSFSDPDAFKCSYWSTSIHALRAPSLVRGERPFKPIFCLRCLGH